MEVELSVNGIILDSIPEYGAGWSVTAKPDGTINSMYPYLFYEVMISDLEFEKGGWIVPSDELGPWFDSKLAKLGLNEKEIADFKEYWLDNLPGADAYLIRIVDADYLDENVRLGIQPPADTVIRIILHFSPAKGMEKTEEPAITNPQRSGFTVVEWGGIVDP